MDNNNNCNNLLINSLNYDVFHYTNNNIFKRKVPKILKLFKKDVKFANGHIKYSFNRLYNSLNKSCLFYRSMSQLVSHYIKGDCFSYFK